jgi:hypothetical protein
MLRQTRPDELTLARRCALFCLVACGFASSGCSRIILDYSFFLEIQATVEDAAHDPLEGVAVLFLRGTSEEVELAETDAEGIASGRHAYLWGVREGSRNPPPVSFTLIFRKEGFRPERHSFHVADLPERDGSHLVECRVVLVRT